MFLTTTLAFLAAWAVLPALLPGWSAQVVVSDSMAPVIRRGDVVVTAPAEAGGPSVADVIVFADPARGDLVTHRIVEDRGDGTFVTQGDANRTPDALPVTEDRIRGVGRVLVPLAGFPAVWVAEGAYPPVALLLAGAAVGVWASRIGWAPRRPVRAVPEVAAGRDSDRSRRSARRRGRPSPLTTAAALAILALPVAAWGAPAIGGSSTGVLPALVSARFSGAATAHADWATGTWMHWWDHGFGQRRPLTVTTGPAVPAGGYAGYTVRAELDTAALISEGAVRPDCFDLRVTRWDGRDWHELHRVVEGCGTASTSVWFALGEDLAAGASDDRYWLHLGNPAAAAPPADPGEVYLFHDDFSGHAVGSFPSGWSATGGAWTVIEEGGDHVLRLQGSGGGNDGVGSGVGGRPGGGNTGGGSGGDGPPGGGGGTATHLATVDGLTETDVRVEARLRMELANRTRMCTAARMDGGTAGELHAGCVARSGGARTDQLLRLADGATAVLAEADSTATDGAWTHLALVSVGGGLALDRDGTRVLTAADGEVGGPGSVGILVEAGNVDIDVGEVVVRRVAEVEPTVVVGVAEMAADAHG